MVLQRLSDFESLTEKKRKLNTKKTHPASEDAGKADPNPSGRQKEERAKMEKVVGSSALATTTMPVELRTRLLS